MTVSAADGSLGPAIERTLAGLSLEQRVAQLCWLTVHGGAADEAHPGNQSRFGSTTPAEVIARFAPGGVVYFAWSGNTAHPVQTATLSAQLQDAARQAGAGLPLAIAVDAEGGGVARLDPPTVRWPSARALAPGDLPRRKRCRAGTRSVRSLRPPGSPSTSRRSLT